MREIKLIAINHLMIVESWYHEDHFNSVLSFFDEYPDNQGNKDRGGYPEHASPNDVNELH